MSTALAELIARPWYRLPLCWLGMCACRPASDETGCWGKCVTCGRRAGFVSREDLRSYLDREAADLRARQFAQGERPVSIIEQIGERCLKVVRDHAETKEADFKLIADFMWALGVRMNIEFVERKE